MIRNILVLEAKTWMKDGPLLYDYESSDQVRQIFKMKSSSFVAIDHSSALLKTSGSYSDYSIVKISELDNEFIVSPIQTEPAGLVLSNSRCNLNKGFKLVKAQKIRLGRVTLKIKDLALSSRNPEPEDLKLITKDEVCRICYDNQESNRNPLISNCNCTGSTNYVHFKCLQKWILSRASIKSNTYSATYKWDSVECEICKTRLPFKFIHKGQKFKLMDFEKPNGPFILLQVKKKELFPFVFYLIEPQDSPISIGRGVDNDVSISDLSISRTHAVIEMRESFYLRDLNSKFGTLLLIKKPILIDRNEPIRLQINKSLLQFSIITSNEKKCCGLCVDRDKVGLGENLTQIKFDDKYDRDDRFLIS